MILKDSDKGKTVVLGYGTYVNLECGGFCVLTTKFPWQWLVNNKAYITDVGFRCYDSGGYCDSLSTIDRMFESFKKEHLKVTSSKIILSEPLTVLGHNFGGYMGNINLWYADIWVLYRISTTADEKNSDEKVLTAKEVIHILDELGHKEYEYY